MKANTFITGRRAKPIRSPLIETAKFLASTARRFAQGKANVGDVEIAITEWRCALAEGPKDAKREVKGE